MKKYISIFLVLLIASCSLYDLEQELTGVSESYDSDSMSPYASVPVARNPYTTKSLIDKETSQSMEANFLRIDEAISNDDGQGFSGLSWDKSYVLEASVISSPDNSENNLRSVYLNPVQSYKIKVTGEEKNRDTVFYSSRMVSWYPKTCILPKSGATGEPSVTMFSYFGPENGANGYNIDQDGNLSVLFTGLNGEKDIMVSDMLEAQRWHSSSGDASYRTPFGKNEASPTYEKFFTYRHYMSAIKVFVFSTAESDQSVSMWGAVNGVVVRNQPSQCQVTLPDLKTVLGAGHNATLAGGAETSSEFYSVPPGEAEFSGSVDFNLIKTSLFGDDANNENGELVAPENPEITQEMTYLGYALVQPETKVILDIHTESGIYSVTIPTVINDNEILKESNIYNIALNFNTTGSISAILLTDSDYSYFDLSTGDSMTSEHIQDETVYKLANCYIVDPAIMKEGSTDEASPDSYYDGYAFLASVIGNGDQGILSSFKEHPSSDIDPVSARLIWESSKGLVTNVELLYDYVRFRVQKPLESNGNGGYSRVDPVEGNAVIAVFDENQEILWSWHIWVTDTPEDISYSLGGVTDVTILDRNLGATAATIPETPTDDDVLATYGLYYQWGRKDPSMGPPTPVYNPRSTISYPYYTYFGKEETSVGVVNLQSPTMKDAVQNPMYLLLPTTFTGSYQYDWLGEKNDDLWRGTDSSDDSAPLKTIYDPCPYGYRVPKDVIGSLMVETFDNKNYNYTPGDYGYTISSNIYEVQDSDDVSTSVFFPFAGYKGGDKGVSSLNSWWKYVGLKGDYMSAKIHSATNHRVRTYLSKDTGGWTEYGADGTGNGHGNQSAWYSASKYFRDYANRRVAGSVRCVKADLGNMGDIDASLSVDDNVVVLGPQGGDVYISYSVLGSFYKLTEVSIVQNNSDGAKTDIYNFLGSTYDQISGKIKIDSSKGTSFILTARNEKGISVTKELNIKIMTLTPRLSEGNVNDGYIYGKEYTGLQISGMPLDDSGGPLYKLYINGTEVTDDKTEYSSGGSATVDGLSYYIPGHLRVELKSDSGELSRILEMPTVAKDNYAVVEDSQISDVVDDFVYGGCYILRGVFLNASNDFTSYYWHSSEDIFHVNKLGALENISSFPKDYVFAHCRTDWFGEVPQGNFSNKTCGIWYNLAGGYIRSNDSKKFSFTDYMDEAYTIHCSNQNPNINVFGANGDIMYFQKDTDMTFTCGYGDWERRVFHVYQVKPVE